MRGSRHAARETVLALALASAQALATGCLRIGAAASARTDSGGGLGFAVAGENVCAMLDVGIGVEFSRIEYEEADVPHDVGRIFLSVLGRDRNRGNIRGVRLYGLGVGYAFGDDMWALGPRLSIGFESDAEHAALFAHLMCCVWLGERSDEFDADAEVACSLGFRLTLGGW